MIVGPHIRKLVSLALEEDLAAGDPTTEYAVPSSVEGCATIVAKEPLVLCGADLIAVVFEELRWQYELERVLIDGSEVKAGEALAIIRAAARHLLSLERTILNFLQRLSGIATHTRSFVGEMPGLVVLDTRKTTPGWRLLEKYAVKTGGAQNHRFNLGDMLLVKNNHIDLNGGDIAAVLRRIRAEKPFYAPIEVEVRSMGELQAALTCGVDAVLLDNMSDKDIAQAVLLVREKSPQTIIEASGGITKDRLAVLAASGVDCVSVSALTGRAVNVDIAMRIAAKV